MDIETTSRLYALELLTTQLISELLRAVPEPEKQAAWARAHLHRLAATMPVESQGFDEEARLRLIIKDGIVRILDAALLRAQTTPLRPPSWDTGPQAG